MTPAETLVEEWASWNRTAGYRAFATAKKYRAEVLAFVRDRKLADFAAATLRDLDAHVIAAQLKGLAAGSIRSRLIALREFYKWACDRKLLHENVAALMRLPPREDDGPVTVLEPKERVRLFAAASAQKPPAKGKREPQKFFELRARKHAGQAERDRAYFEVAYSGAMRVSEAAALLWEDVLRPDGRDGNLSLVIRQSKHHRHPATVHLGKAASSALDAWKIARDAAGKRDPRIFGISSAALAATFDRCAREAGLQRPSRRLTPHVLRASRATDALRSGMSEIEVARLLRHRGTGSLSRYIKAANETRRRAMALASLPEYAGHRILRREISPAD